MYQLQLNAPKSVKAAAPAKKARFKKAASSQVRGTAVASHTVDWAVDWTDSLLLIAIGGTRWDILIENPTVEYVPVLNEETGELSTIVEFKGVCDRQKEWKGGLKRTPAGDYVVAFLENVTTERDSEATSRNWEDGVAELAAHYPGLNVEALFSEGATRRAIAQLHAKLRALPAV